MKQKAVAIFEKAAAHFSLQSKELFDALKVFFVEDRESLKKIEFLENDLKSIKVAAWTFFEEYSGELKIFKGGNFHKDLNILRTELVDRIRSEKQFLIPLLDQFFG